MTAPAYTAAWVPDDDPERPWDDAANLAVDWILSEAGRLEIAPLLVTPTQHRWSSGAESIRWFAQHHTATTPRSDWRSRSAGPVLAYVPDYHTFELAARQARGSSLAVVESVSNPLRGWGSRWVH